MRGDRHRKIMQSDLGSGRQRDTGIDRSFELPDVAGPIIAEQIIHCFRSKWTKRLPIALANLLEKSVRQQWNVLLPFAQWRDPNFDDVQAIKQVLPELAFADQYAQIAVSRCNQPEICLDCLIAADSLKQTRIE